MLKRFFAFLRPKSYFPPKPAPEPYVEPEPERRGNFEKDTFTGQWMCLECCTGFRNHPGRCPHCTPMMEPQYAKSWRLQNNAVKVGEEFIGAAGWQFGNLRHEIYIGVSYHENSDTYNIVRYEAASSSLGSTTFPGLSREDCGQLALLLWQASQGADLNLYKES